MKVGAFYVLDDAHERWVTSMMRIVARGRGTRKIAYFNRSVAPPRPDGCRQKIVPIGVHAGPDVRSVDRREDYPRFLPGAAAAKCMPGTRRSPGPPFTSVINYHGIKSHFSTENESNYPSNTLIRFDRRA